MTKNQLRFSFDLGLQICGVAQKEAGEYFVCNVLPFLGQLIEKEDLKLSNVQERVVRRRLSVLGLYHHDVGRNHGRNDLGAIHKIRRQFFLIF